MTNAARKRVPKLTRKQVKEAQREWLDEKFAAFGKWSLAGIAAAGLVAFLYFILTINGWKPPGH